jgi:hypothetical protein
VLTSFAVVGCSSGGSSASSIPPETATATPSFAPAAGNFTAAQTVTVSDATAGATIYYTTDGTTPTNASSVYSAPIQVGTTTTIKALAYAAGDLDSNAVSATYTINQQAAAAPTFSPAAGTYASAQSVTLADATPGATIYYTLDGSTPTAASTKYTGAIAVSATTTIQAIATASGFSTSAISSAVFTINTPLAATPTFSPAAGTYTSAQNVTLADATPGATIYYTTSGTAPTTSSTRYTSAIPVSATTTIEAIASASGYTTSAAASATYTIGTTATTINQKLGKPNRVLMGLGANNSLSDMQTQGIAVDIIDTYLPGVGSGSWINYNSPSGSYVSNVASQDIGYGAIPMFTLYGMAQNGDGNISDINQSSFMDSYWSQARLMFQQIGSYHKPTLVNLEPDFWGYVENDAPNNDPTQLAAVVNDQSECSSLPNTAAGIAMCLLAMGRQYAPQALIGYPASFFGENAPTVANFMSKIGAQNADFIVAQTSDRDAGCPESSSPPPECQGRTGPFYWDENNVTTPNFQQSLTMWSTYRSDLPNSLPILWWQTPLGVPSSTPGGTTNHYRDDHVDYMMKNTNQYGAIDSFGIVFSGGASSQTGIATDGGEFATLLKTYLSSGGSEVY